jgi:nitronate monooxygenase
VPTAEWIKYIRARDPEIRIFTTVNTVEEARVAAEEWNVDVLGIQGIEAGGHGLGSAPPRDALLAAVINEAPKWKRIVPVIAAGGIADGRGVAAVLVQGAAGAALGTRFLVTPESLYTDAQKALLVSAGPGDTLRSMAFDDARGTTNWPAGIDGRGLMSPTVAEYEDAAARGAIDSEAEQRRNRYSALVTAGETERMITWSGTGIGSITSVVPAGEIVSSITAEAARLLVAGAQLVHQG